MSILEPVVWLGTIIVGVSVGALAWPLCYYIGRRHGKRAYLRSIMIPIASLKDRRSGLDRRTPIQSEWNPAAPEKRDGEERRKEPKP